MNITPETEPLVSARRALELANKISPTDSGFTIPTCAEAKEISACLKSYAELSQKWQAVLDAEPAFTIRLWSYKQDPAMQNFDLEYETMPDGVYQLIIKPAP